MRIEKRIQKGERIVGWRLGATNADNSGHAGFVLGSTVRRIRDLDLRLEGVMLGKRPAL
jgi:2-keto-4-pentenoate hydratase